MPNRYQSQNSPKPTTPLGMLASIQDVESRVCVQQQIAKNAPAGTFDSYPHLFWKQNFGGSGNDCAFYAATTGESYVVVGSSTSFLEGKTVACITLLDEDGGQVWNRTNSEGYGAEFRYVQTLDDGFFVAGNSFSDNGSVYGLVMKLDAQGYPVWNVTLMVCEGVNKLFSCVADGSDLVVAGLTQPEGGGTSLAWLTKLTDDGSIVWSRTYAESVDIAARAVAVTRDGCYVAASPDGG